MSSEFSDLPFLYRISESKIRTCAESVGGELYDSPQLPSVDLVSLESVSEHVQTSLGKTFQSKVLAGTFSITQRAMNHILGSDKTQGGKDLDVFRRGRLLLTAIDIAQNSPTLLVVDSNSDREKGITYFEILGQNIKYFPDRYIVVKISEHKGGGKILWSLVDIKA
jgi:hypothetical protein